MSDQRARRRSWDEPIPDDWRPRRYPRIRGFGPGAGNLARALCAVCPDDVHGSVETVPVDKEAESYRLIVGLLCGPDHTLWRYDTVVDPATDWEREITPLVTGVWQPTT